MTVDQGGIPLEASPARSLGDLFRTTRTAAGVAIEQVESDLRIKAKYIEAIEDGDLAELPSRAYTDGFIRNYATYLGMDPADSVRRFASEQGIAKPKTRRPKVAPMPKAKKTNPISGYPAPAPRRGFFGTLGRGLVAMMPLVLFAGTGFAGYTGFVAARDAGLIPPELGGQVRAADETAVDRTASSGKAEPSKTASLETDKKPAVATENDEKTVKTDAEPKTESEANETKVVEAKPDLIGDEIREGRPESLTYAQTGSTPYWQAKPPAVEPADGPISEIEPEDAGLLRADADTGEDERLSRWSSSGAVDRPTEDVDASRIAAEARKALFGSDAPEVVDPQNAGENSFPEGEQGIEVASLDVSSDTDQPIANTAQTIPSQPVTDSVAGVLVEGQPGIGPVETQPLPSSNLAPVTPAQPSRNFALVAQADTWVQITDAIGNVTYTGILSPGEAYNIPVQDGLRLKTGNAGGLLIEVDGQRFGPLGTSGAVMRNVVLNPGAVRASFTLSREAALQQ